MFFNTIVFAKILQTPMTFVFVFMIITTYVCVIQKVVVPNVLIMILVSITVLTVYQMDAAWEVIWVLQKNLFVFVRNAYMEKRANLVQNF